MSSNGIFFPLHVALNTVFFYGEESNPEINFKSLPILSILSDL